MTNLDDLIKFCREKIKEYPQLKNSIYEAYSDAVCEIEAEESETSECEKAMEDIDEMIEEIKTKNK